MEVGCIQEVVIQVVVEFILAGAGYIQVEVLAYILAEVGIVSHVPAGLGVIESVLLLLLPDVPPEQLLASVLMYRVIFEIIPLLIALAVWGSFETFALDGVRSYGLELPRDVLDERIGRRVELMWEQGFVAEVEGLLSQGLREGRTASRALGYRQILAFLDGETSEAEAKDATIRGTRRFARKQLGWFRRDARIGWRPAGEPGLADGIADALAAT